MADNTNDPNKEEEELKSKWFDTESTTVEIEWNFFETEFPISPDKELVSIKVDLVNSEDFKAYFDNLELRKNLMNDKLLGNEIVYIPIEGVDAGEQLSRIVFGAVGITEIIKVSYAPEEDILGSAGMMKLSLINSRTKDELCTSTFIDTRNEMANTVFDFGPIKEAFAYLQTGDTLRFIKSDETSGAKLPRGVLIIQWDIA